VPAHACVGAALGENEPATLLYGRHLEHRIVYLPLVHAVEDAQDMHISYVIVTMWADTSDPDEFRNAHWTVQPLPGGLWQLATAPHPQANCG
jgi:hypothetical protein